MKKTITLFLIITCALTLAAIAQDKATVIKADNAKGVRLTEAKPPAEHALSKEELAILRDLEAQLAIVNEGFQKLNADLDKVLTDEQALALVRKLQLLRRQNKDIQDAGFALINDWRKKYKCPTCELKDGKFVPTAQPEKK